jgi:hypothetical protein
MKAISQVIAKYKDLLPIGLRIKQGCPAEVNLILILYLSHIGLSWFKVFVAFLIPSRLMMEQFLI